MKVKLLFLLLILGCLSFSMNPVTTKYESVKEEKSEKNLDKKRYSSIKIRKHRRRL